MHLACYECATPRSTQLQSPLKRSREVLESEKPANGSPLRLPKSENHILLEDPMDVEGRAEEKHHRSEHGEELREPPAKRLKTKKPSVKSPPPPLRSSSRGMELILDESDQEYQEESSSATNRAKRH
jgi:hypothetical protein